MSTLNWSYDIQKLYRQRWRIWVVGVLAHTIGMFHRAAMAPVADRVMADFGINALAFGSLGAVYFYVYAAMQLPSGTLADILGPRKTITAGLLLSTLGSLTMGLAPSFVIVYIGRFLVSFGVSVVWLSVIKLLMGWFRSQEMATMSGTSSSLAHLGQVAATTPLAIMVIWVGWRMSFVAIGLVSFALAIANWFTVKDSPEQVRSPSVAELDGQAIIQAAASGISPNQGLVKKFRIVLSNKHLWSPFFLGFGTYGAYVTMFNNWAVVYLMQTYNMSREFAANFSLLATVGLMVGFPAVGFLSDRIFRKRCLPAALSAGLLLACFLILTLWNSGKPRLEALYPLCFLMGLGGGALSITFAYIRDIVQPPIRGIASGLANTGAFVGAAIVQPLFGYVLDLGWRGEMMEGARVYPLEAFQHGLFLCCALAAVGFLGALLLKETHCRELL